ncbi:MAG: prolipoprotein diacylglyceryl transferase [Firmicutes bacterium]|nr:prolipoprotein diacylglyceryl transferase [Bacillota bacterium]
MDLNLDPIAFTLGPVAVHWYGIFMAVSILVGFYYFRRDALRLGHDEDFLYNLAFIMVIGGVIGARLVYVLTNWSDYAVEPINILRIRQGGLSFHGGMIGGAIPGWLYIRAKGKRVGQLFDLIVPGVCVGIILVRIGNLINGEVLGRTTEIGLDRHPAQIYASFLGLVLLIIHNVIARRRPPEGYLSWSFILYYSLFRGLIEETVRENPLYWPVYLNETYGIGLFTLTHLITPPLLVLAWWMRRRIAVTYATAHKRRRRR